MYKRPGARGTCLSVPHCNGSRSSSGYWGTGCRGHRGRRELWEVCPSALPGPKALEMKMAAAKGNLTLVVLGINPVVINQKQDVAFTELSSFGSFEINQNDFTWPSLLQAYICLKHLF